MIQQMFSSMMELCNPAFLFSGWHAPAQVLSEPDVTRALDLARAEFGSSPFVAVNCAGIGYAKRTISR